MVLYEDGLAAYSPGLKFLIGGFRLNGTTPDTLRDGTNAASSKKMFTVTHLGTGHYKVVFNDNVRPLPIHPVILPTIEQAAPATTKCTVHYVQGTWSASTRSFELEVETVGTTPAASDADVGNRIAFLIVGGYDGPAVDPA